jgi:uncharacterized protein YxjI
MTRAIALTSVDGEALRVRDTFVLKDRDGSEVASIQEKLRARDTMKLERDGRKLATVHKALVGILHRFDIDIEGRDDLSARGNIVDDEYEVKRDGEVIATVSKKWLRVRDTYGIEIRQGEDEPPLLARAVALDKRSRN